MLAILVPVAVIVGFVVMFYLSTGACYHAYTAGYWKARSENTERLSQAIGRGLTFDQYTGECLTDEMEKLGAVPKRASFRLMWRTLHPQKQTTS